MAPILLLFTPPSEAAHDVASDGWLVEGLLDRLERSSAGLWHVEDQSEESEKREAAEEEICAKRRVGEKDCEGAS